MTPSRVRNVFTISFLISCPFYSVPTRCSITARSKALALRLRGEARLIDSDESGRKRGRSGARDQSHRGSSPGQVPRCCNPRAQSCVCRDDMRTRDEQFRTFFNLEAERLRRLAIFLTGDTEAGADMAQETLARLYRHWGRVKSDDPGPYARRILVNLVRSSHRRRFVERRFLERRHREPQPGSEPSVASQSGHVDEFLRISSALKCLSPIGRAAIVLRFYEDMSEADIARTLDRPVGTVKSDIHRGLAKLRPLLEDIREPI
ncbi:MAG: sigma-70 family RNA polymerase sigma factor [Actinobacteria bacterium]|nr:sigma-70 family RNA polymerase sigma factor [Actinomycetota bacterium]